MCVGYPAPCSSVNVQVSKSTASINGIQQHKTPSSEWQDPIRQLSQWVWV